jgi:zinc transporter 1/2/3
LLENEFPLSLLLKALLDEILQKTAFDLGASVRMDQVGTLVQHLVRQVAGAGSDNATIVVPLTGTSGHCNESNDFNGNIGVRISSIFVILVGSLMGAVFPIWTRRRGISSRLIAKFFFAAKYFGSGVIIATAFIHLLAPAADSLTNECLTGPITEYDWAEGIALMTIFVLFFIELMTMRYANFGHNHSHSSSDAQSEMGPHTHNSAHDPARAPSQASTHENKDISITRQPSHVRGEDHLGHSRTHIPNEDVTPSQLEHGLVPETYVAQMTAIFILEFGVIFHSIFIGLTLAVSGNEFATLYVVLVFHQTFEGLGLGTRLASAPWPKHKDWTPYAMAVGYAVSTPLAIAVGLAIRTTYAPGSQTALISNGIFDSISAGILIYTGLVELMAHEFMFSETMRKAKLTVVLGAFGLMCLGAALMALLGKWA